MTLEDVTRAVNLSQRGSSQVQKDKRVRTVSARAQKPPGLFLVSQQPLLHTLSPLVQSVRNQLEPAESFAEVKVLKDREMFERAGGGAATCESASLSELCRRI